MASEIILIAKVAEEACATAVNDPSNLDARTHLLNAVEAFVDATGQKAVLNTQPIGGGSISKGVSRTEALAAACQIRKRSADVLPFPMAGSLGLLLLPWPNQLCAGNRKRN